MINGPSWTAPPVLPPPPPCRPVLKPFTGLIGRRASSHLFCSSVHNVPATVSKVVSFIGWFLERWGEGVCAQSCVHFYERASGTACRRANMLRAPAKYVVMDGVKYAVATKQYYQQHAYNMDESEE